MTFTKDIAPILQRSCQECHHPDGGAPMSLVTYDEVRPWARAMKTRTASGRAPARCRRGSSRRTSASRSSRTTRRSAKRRSRRSRSGPTAARRAATPRDMPPAAQVRRRRTWTLGEPDLVVKSQEVLVPAHGPDKWGSIGPVPTGLTEDRYVSSVEVREVNDIPRSGGTKTVGGRYVFHHMTYRAPPRRARHGRRIRQQLADSRSRPQRRHLPAGSRPAPAAELGAAT